MNEQTDVLIVMKEAGGARMMKSVYINGQEVMVAKDGVDLDLKEFALVTLTLIPSSLRIIEEWENPKV